MVVIKIPKNSLCVDCLNVLDVTIDGYEGDCDYKFNGKYFKHKFICIKWGKEINYDTILKCNMHRPRKKKKIQVAGCPSASFGS